MTAHNNMLIQHVDTKKKHVDTRAGDRYRKNTSSTGERDGYIVWVFLSSSQDPVFIQIDLPFLFVQSSKGTNLTVYGLFVAFLTGRTAAIRRENGNPSVQVNDGR